MRLSLAMLFLTSLTTQFACAQEAKWPGEWITDQGVMTLNAGDGGITGEYSKAGKIDAKPDGNKLSGTFSNGNAQGKIAFEISADGLHFEGTWNSGRNSGRWRGWRGASEPAKEPVDFTGAYVSTWGTIQLEQNGDEVSGTYGPRGWGKITGKVVGRRLKLKWRKLRFNGGAVLELTPEGERIFGKTDGNPPTVWTGLRVDDFPVDPQLAPGKTVQGRTSNGMLYFLRMPDDWKKGDATDLIVLLHGSNWTTRGMVGVTAKNWPKVGRRFAILGIQGDQWASWSNQDDLRFNYFYVNWMGRSTYKGYPNTDRDSPYLAMQVIEDLSEEHNFERVFVGGHSQGGYLTYLLHMHYADKLAGTFPVAGGLVMQAEPDVFEDKELIDHQRSTPMVIVHGTNDRVVPYSTAKYIQRRLLAHEFPKTKLLDPNSGHPYDFLPIGDAIEWLDVMSTDDADILAKFASAAVDEKRWRDVGAALLRAKELNDLGRLEKASAAYDRAALVEAEKYAKLIESNSDGSWIDDYLNWHDSFSIASSAQATVGAFRKLRENHGPKAKETMSAARKAFRQGNSDEGWAKYQEIADKFYASSQYRTVSHSLKNRK